MIIIIIILFYNEIKIAGFVSNFQIQNNNNKNFKTFFFPIYMF